MRGVYGGGSVPAGTAGLVLAAMLAGAGPAHSQENWEWSGGLARGQEIQVEGVRGTIRAVAARPGQDASVRATLSGPGAEDGVVRVVAVEHGDGVTICALYPARRGRRENKCTVGDGGRNWNIDDVDVRVDFEITVPTGVHFVGRTISGRVVATGLDGTVHAGTVNGDVQVETSGAATASTVSGDLEVSMGRIPEDGAEFSTVSGDITVELPDGAAADVSFRSVSGDIESDFPLTLARGGRRVEGTVGGGGPRLIFRSVSGDLVLRRRGG
jgi:hypothetical protein